MEHQPKIFKIKKFMKYSLKQYAVYSVLACYTDNKQISHISRDVLAHLSGVSDLDTISKYTKQFALDGLITKTIKYSQVTGNKLVEYKILEPQDDYLFCTNKLFSGNAELIGFLCLLAQYKVGNSNLIKLSPSTLIRKMEIGRTTFYKYMKIALQDGSVTKTDDGYVLSDEIFPPFERVNKPTAKQKKKINEILDSNTKAEKILLDYYNPNLNEFSGLKGNIDDFLNFCLSGVPKKSKTPIEQPVMDYQF